MKLLKQIRAEIWRKASVNSDYLEASEQFRQIGNGNAQDIEEFADLLEIAVINLKEASLDYELHDGSLYGKLQCKLQETVLAQYHRLIFEKSQGRIGSDLMDMGTPGVRIQDNRLKSSSQVQLHNSL